MKEQPKPEFSRVVDVEELEPGEEIVRSIEPSEEERLALAKRLGLLGLEDFAADVTLRRMAGGALVRARGRLTAKVVQRCVVTLKAVENSIEEEFDELFAPEGYQPADEEEEEELPESFDGRKIDIGEMTAQLLSLALDPYPRAPGAESPAPASSAPEESGRRRPFEGLADMLKKRN
jgi:uncharacterized metal-binding protein YceD (DUF177 family)